MIPLYNSGANPDGSYSLSGNWLPGAFPMIDGKGLHLPFQYTSPATVDNGQENWTHEVRLQSNDPAAQFVWTTGLFFSLNKQSYLEQIHDPMLNQLSLAVTGQPYAAFFACFPSATGPAVAGCTNPAGTPVTYDPRFPNDSYFLENHAEDKQLAWFGEGTYAFTDQLKATVGARVSRNEFSFNTLTGGPQLFLPPQTKNGDKKENSFTPKLSLQYQYDPHDMYYFTYSKGFRPGGANNPVPAAACGTDFQNFGIKAAPDTYNSDTVDSFEVGAKNNIDNRIHLASSVYYIRWNNIQQTVVPPICQISFVSNLGQAIAKGIDFQADIAVTEALGLEVAAGYTDARYTRNSRLSSTEAYPIAASGDAISGQSGSGLSGQPAAPFTLTLGFEYKFDAWSHESFVRVDDEYSARSKWNSPSQDPTTQQYDPANYVLSSTQFASIRAGTGFGNLQVAAFIDNLTDTHTITNYEWSIDPGSNPNTGAALASRLQRNYTYRPRTFGLTFTYRTN